MLIVVEEMAKVPRKKFSLSSEISLALRRYNLVRSGLGWNIELDKSIVRLIVEAYRDKFLYVNGSPVSYQIPVRSIPELLEYLKILPVPEAKEIATKRLQKTPLFYGVSPITSHSGNLCSQHKLPKEEMKQAYEKCERTHKVQEHHHPDGLGWDGGIAATIECVFDVFNSVLRTNTLLNAYNKLFNIFLDDKFANLDLQGIFYAFLHISIRGVANSQNFYNSGNWRREPVTQALLFKVSEDFANGLQPRALIAAYMRETLFHMRTMTKELQRLRIPHRHDHDYTKVRPEMVYSYAWYWGIYQRFTLQNKYRFDTGNYSESPIDQIVAPGICNPTMFSVKVADSAAVSEIVELLKELPNKFDNVVDKMDDKLSAQQQHFGTIAKDIIEQNATETKRVGEHLIDKIVEKSTVVGDNMLKSFEPAIEALTSFTGVIENMIGKVVEFLKPIPGFSKLELNVKSIFDALSYYILYVNTESTVLKTILIVLILNCFGLIKTAFTELMRFWSWTQDEVVLNGDTMPANETSDLFSWLASSPIELVKSIGAIIAGMIKGIPLTPKEFLSLSKKLAENLKSFHFISQGIGGITKIFDYCKKAYTCVVEWIAVHIFGRTPDKERLALQTVRMMVKVKYLHTEAGMNAIRMSEGVRVQAEKILSEYLALQAELRTKPEYRQMYCDLDKINRQVKEVSDFVTRLRNISNFQPTMFHIQFVGRPGIGKSTITKNVVSDLSKTLWPEEPKASFYSYNTDLEYFDGYAGQKIMIVDDLYKINDPKHLTASMFLVTNTPVILPMANLNDKGVQMTSEILLSSTNTTYPIGKDVLCMEAIHRRRHMLVEVICDQDVIDPSLGQFSLARFERKYKGKKPSDFPHLTFNLLRPVPQEFGGAAADSLAVGTDEFKIYQEYASKLKEANMHIAMADQKLDPMFYFSEDNEPPQGISLPAMGWTYKQFISNCAVRFLAFRGAEDTYTTQKKYGHVEYCLEEIDALLAQSNDIRDGVEIPITKQVETLLCRAQHPYGTTDEIGQKLLETPNVAPELNDIDLDKLVDEIITEKNPTTLELTEEQIRTQRILKKKKRKPVDPILRDMLKIEEIDGKRYIPIQSHFTSWYQAPTIPRENLAEVFMHARNVSEHPFSYDNLRLRRLHEEDPSAFKILYSMLKESLVHCHWDVNNFLKWYFSKNMFYPDSEEFPEDLRGKDTTFPISFFKSMTKIGAQWYIDVTEIEGTTGFHSQKIKVTPYLDGPVYEIEADFAFLLSTMSNFRIFCSDFDNLTIEQKERLVNEAKWRSTYFGTYSYAHIADECSSIYKKMCYKTLHYVSSPLRYIAENYPFITSVVAYFLVYASVTYLLTKISELFCPKPTSKFLHKSPQSTLIQYTGARPTAALEIDCDTPGTPVYQLSRSLLKRSIREIVISDSNGGFKVQALLSGQYIICNKHCFKYIKDEEIQIAIQSFNREREYTRHIVTRKNNIYIDPDGDLALVFSPSFPAVRQVTQHLISETEYIEHDFPSDLIFLSSYKDGHVIDHHGCATKVQNMLLRNSKYSNTIDNGIFVKGSTVCGRSGSPVLASMQGQPRIVGIQAWEFDILVSPKIMIQVVTKERFERMKEAYFEQSGYLPIERLVEPELTEVVGNETSAFASVDPTYLIGSDSHSVGLVGKSQIKPSIIYDELQRVGITSDSVPAALNPCDPRLFHKRKIHPLAHSLGKYFRGNIEPFQPSILGYCSNSITKFLRVKLDKREFKRLTIEDTITGTREDGSNPMNLRSSPGIPFIFEQHQEKGKRDYMQIDEFGMVSTIDEEFLEGYYKFFNTLSQRKLPYTRAYDFPKDELRPFVKALGSETTPPKTRSVTCMNVYYILAWRQLTLDFWASMHRAADGTIPFCPGINPEGPEWNNLYHYLNRHPNVIDFDVSNWDGFLRPELFLESCKILKSLHNYSESDSNVIDAIAFEVMNTYIQYGSTIYSKDRGLVSGFPGTAEINTMSHWLLILYIYIKITNNTKYNTFQAFISHVSIAIYGDDIIISFSDEIRPLFNGLTIAEGYQEIGYPVTSASKDQTMVESKTLSECTFLKSSWREFLPQYFIRKIDTKVINNLVLWTRSKQDPIQQFYDNYLDALRLAFANGENEFTSFQERVNLVLARSGRDMIAFDYLDFERDYLQRYLPQVYHNLLDYNST